MPDCIRETFTRDLVKNSTRLKQGRSAARAAVHARAPVRTFVHACTRAPYLGVSSSQDSRGRSRERLGAIFKRRTIHRFARSQRHSEARSKSPINVSALPRFIFRPCLSIKRPASMYRICLSRSYNYRAIYLYTVPLLFTPRRKHNPLIFTFAYTCRDRRVSRARAHAPARTSKRSPADIYFLAIRHANLTRARYYSADIYAARVKFACRKWNGDNGGIATMT